MDLFLKVVGGIALAGLLGIGLLILLIRWGLRSLKTAQPPPSTIDLEQDDSPEWLKSGRPAREAAELEALGYSRASTYTVTGIPGVQVLGLCHEQSGAFGCYYNHQAVGNFVDLCANLSDGLELTITNAPMGVEMDTRPGTEKVFLPGKSISELHATLADRIAGNSVSRASAASFKNDFLAAYAKDMKWRADKQGVSEAEFQRVAARDGKKYTAERLAEAFEETKLQELHRWSEEALEAFAKTTTLRVAEWQKFEYRMILFREDLHPTAYLQYLRNTVEMTDSDLTGYRDQLVAGMSLRQLLEKITSDTGQKFVRLGEVETPAIFEVLGVTPVPTPQAT